MTIALIAAFTKNYVLGKHNQLIWHLPKDLRYFKEKTLGHPVIMGRKTFESFGKPLKGRTNIIVTRNPAYQVEGAVVVTSLPEAVTAAEKCGSDTIFIAGGAEIYQQALPLADMMYLTHIHAWLEGDAFFPSFSTEEWQAIAKEAVPADDKHAYSFDFIDWKRIKSN